MSMPLVPIGRFAVILDLLVALNWLQGPFS
jgi:hypothetical protein